jgi:hypothetical protein
VGRLPSTVSVAVLGLLEVVFGLVTKHGACNCPDDAVAAHLVAAKVAGCTAAESAHQAAVSLALHGGVG